MKRDGRKERGKSKDNAFAEIENKTGEGSRRTFYLEGGE